MTSVVMQDYDPRAVPPTSLEEQARAARIAAKALSLAERKAREESAAEAARVAYLERIAAFVPAQVVSQDKTVTIGSEWWCEPFLMGYGDVWQPTIVRVVSLVTDPMPPSNPLTGPAPVRQYVVRLDGGTQLFANDASLFYVNLARTGPRES